MESSASARATRPAPSGPPEDKIRHLPEGARAALRGFQASGRVGDLDPLIVAILEFYAPRSPARPLAELPGTTRLMEDLGFDSLAITEIVFLTEDVFEIRITNDEILAVRTIGDLRSFIHTKVAARAAA